MAVTTYTCAVCGQTFSDEGSLSSHMIRDHSTKTEVAEEGEAK